MSVGGDRLNMVKLKKVKNGYILYSEYGHSHFKNKSAAAKCRCLINKGILPNQPYFVESCKRLLSEKEFQRLENKKEKEHYININKGVRR